MVNDAIIEFHNVTKRFPGVTALSAVTLSIARGEVHVLVGENGAGKSSLIKLLAGIYAPDGGEILYEGAPYKPHDPTDAFRAGIRVVHQELNLLPYLSVAENLLIENLPRRGALVDYPAMYQRAAVLLDEVGLDISPRTRVEQLGIAQMQQVEIAKALCYQSKVLILDEPTATLTPKEISRLFEIIRRLRAKGVTFIYISHRLHEIYEIGDRVTVLRNGQLVATQQVHAVTILDIVKMMVGREMKEEFIFRASVRPGGEIFRVDGLKRSERTPDVSFSLREGEILGVAGLVGSGRTETMRAIFGADSKLAGVTVIDGQTVDIRTPRDAVEHGLCLLTEDRKVQGLMLDLPVDVNITITDLAKISHNGLLARAEERRDAAQLVQDLNINGLITNDKFCITREVCLKLSGRRKPLKERVDGDTADAAPSCGGRDETRMDEAAAGGRTSRCTTALGSRLPDAVDVDDGFRIAGS